MPQTLTPEQRTERARNAAIARHAKRREGLNGNTPLTLVASAPAVPAAANNFWDTAPIPECEQRLRDLRSESEHGAIIVQRRLTLALDSPVHCEICQVSIPPGRWAQRRDRKDPQTGLFQTLYFCKEQCIKRFYEQQQGIKDLPR